MTPLLASLLAFAPAMPRYVWPASVAFGFGIAWQGVKGGIRWVDERLSRRR